MSNARAGASSSSAHPVTEPATAVGISASTPAALVADQFGQVRAAAVDARRVARHHRSELVTLARHRRQPGGDQRRKRDQRAAAGEPR